LSIAVNQVLMKAAVVIWW